MTQKRKSVSAAFGPAAAGLVNRLPQRPGVGEEGEVPGDTAATPAVQDTGETGEPVVTNPVAHGASAAPAYAEAPDGGSSTTVQVNVHLLPHVISTTEYYRAGRSNAAVVLDTIEAHVDRLPQLVENHRGRPRDQSGSSPFRRGDTVRTQANSTPRRPWTFRLSRENLAVLDQMTITAGATSRSELVEAALAALPPHR